MGLGKKCEAETYHDLQTTYGVKNTHQFAAHIILVAIGYMLSTGGGDVVVTLCLTVQ